MRTKTLGFDEVRKIAVALPDVEESAIHGAPSLKVRGKLLTCPAIHRSAEPNTLAVRIGFAHYNTHEEIDRLVSDLRRLVAA